MPDPIITPVVGKPTPAPPTVLGAPGSVVKPDKSGSVAATVAQADAGALIVCKSAELAEEANTLLVESGKRCSVVVDGRLGVQSLWRRTHTPIRDR